LTVRNIVIVAVTATAVAGPATATPSAPAAPAPIQPTAARTTLQEAKSAAAAIDLEVTPKGLLAMTLTWSGGTEPYDVTIDPSKGRDDTSQTSTTHPSPSPPNATGATASKSSDQTGRRATESACHPRADRHLAATPVSANARGVAHVSPVGRHQHRATGRHRAQGWSSA
jgi:hypothetical protein